MKAILEEQAGAGGLPRCAARYVITGELILDSTTHFGNGETGESVDMLLRRDPVTSRTFLPGSSLAGALRSYACDYLIGYGQDERQTTDREVQRLIVTLFGGVRGDERGDPSALAVFDSYMLSSPDMATPGVELRDGVAIDPHTGTAAEHKKYDMEVLPRGTRLSLHMEMAVPVKDGEQKLISLLRLVLHGLEQGEIPLGSRRTRGFGLCHVEAWRIRRFDLSTAEGWLEWLATSPGTGGPKLFITPHSQVDEALKATLPAGLGILSWPDRRQRITVELDLQFSGSVLVRSAPMSADAPDVAQLRSAGIPLLPGTSLAGVLRSRALRIARLVRAERGDGDLWVESLFGPGPATGGEADGDATDEHKHLFASPLRVSEGAIQGGTFLRVNRIKIDRFTGGVVDNALFEEEPLYGGRVRLSLEMRISGEQQFPEAQLGLLLLVLKDLLTSNLAVGGAQAVGRGFMSGSAVIRATGLRLLEDGREYRLDANGDRLADPATIDAFNRAVRAFHDSPLPPNLA